MIAVWFNGLAIVDLERGPLNKSYIESKYDNVTSIEIYDLNKKGYELATVTENGYYDWQHVPTMTSKPKPKHIEVLN